MYKNLTIVALIALFFPGQVSADSHVDPDFNDDGIVNSFDYALFLAHWGTRVGEPNWDAKFDLKSDGAINSFDYALFLSNWGKKFPLPQSEREALVALYNAADGENWTNNTNWLSNDDISTWHGVRVSGGKVTHLGLRANNLTGEIPAELGNLTNLERLGLEGNQLSGEIPTELGNLSNLEWLGLSFNQLSSEIPAALGNLSSLKQLWLVNNQLSGPIPATLGNLTNLEVLIFYNNQLSGPIPATLGNLTNLERLLLNGNQLRGALPQNLTRLTKLTEFYFGGDTELCAPLDSAFQAWLQGIAASSGDNCSR